MRLFLLQIHMAFALSHNDSIRLSAGLLELVEEIISVDLLLALTMLSALDSLYLTLAYLIFYPIWILRHWVQLFSSLDGQHLCLFHLFEFI